MNNKFVSISSGSDMELGVINQMGFPGYFLIVMEFIRWAKENDIPVGPGRVRALALSWPML